MITKAQIQFLRSLHDKRGRKESGYFLVEGRKGVLEFLHSDMEVLEGFFCEAFAREYAKEIGNTKFSLVSQKELGRISTLASADVGVLVVRIPKYVDTTLPQRCLTLVLDGINDPGNLGTIIRTADWYGIQNIICSSDTVDPYHPKVVMATMGSLTRVQIASTDLEQFFQENPGVPVYGAVLDGENIRTKKFTSAGGCLIIGSESHGISPQVQAYITDKVTIPRIGGAESLNAGVATGILLERMAS